MSKWPKRYFYPRPLRGGRPCPPPRRGESKPISIHALCEEGDHHSMIHATCQAYFYPRPLRGGRRACLAYFSRANLFLSTPSARRATEAFEKLADALRISIHALCEEGDAITRHLLRSRRNFYPRPLRGGRPHTYALKYYLFEFLSTPSARRATTVPSSETTSVEDFYPRPLRGGRQEKMWKHTGAYRFLSTPSARRATREVQP